MKISTRGRYALRVMMDLGLHNNGDFIPLKLIASRQSVTVKYLEQIIAPLSRAGYLFSSRGNGGGYKLARPVEEYTAGEILRTAEGSLAPIACLANGPNRCERRTQCATLPFWEGLNQVINDYVDKITLEELVEQSRTQGGMDFVI